MSTTRSSSRASPSRSTSSQRAGTRLRARKSRRSCESLEKRWPMIRTPPASSAAPDFHVSSRSFDDGVELLLRRVPRLEQVVVERDVVDRLDRRVGVGVRGEQHALGVGDELARLGEVVGAGHAGHALVGDEQRDLVAAGAQLPEQVERLVARARAHDPVLAAERAPQVARDRGEDRGLVVDREDHRPALLAVDGDRVGLARGRRHPVSVRRPPRATATPGPARRPGRRAWRPCRSSPRRRSRRR